jgi:uncharacterized protein YjdB
MKRIYLTLASGARSKLLALFLVLPMLSAFSAGSSHADGGVAPQAPSVSIIRISTGESLVNTSVNVGGTNDDVSLKLNGGTLDTVNWSSSDTNIFTVAGNASSAAIEGKKEGFAKLRLSVKTTDGDTVTDTANVTIYTPIAPSVGGTTSHAAKVWRGADESSTYRGEVPSGHDILIRGECGPFYFADFEDNSYFTDGQNTNIFGYLYKSNVRIPVAGIALDKKSVMLATSGNQSKATIGIASVEPTRDGNILATNYDPDLIKWSSSNKKIAAVNKSGKVTGISPGKATITAEIEGHKDTCAVTVTNIAITSITLDKAMLPLAKGKSYALKATVSPSNSYTKYLKWSTSNKAVASVDGNGKVTKVANGKAVITVQSPDGKVKAQCEVSNPTLQANVSGAGNLKLVRVKSSSKTNTVGYNLINGARYYEFYKKEGSKWTRKLTSKTNGVATDVIAVQWKDTATKYNKLEEYKVVAYKNPNKKDKLKTKTLSVRTGATWNLRASAISDTKITLTWGSVSGVSGYIIYRSAKKGSGYKQVKKITKAGTSSWTNEKLSPNKTYYYKIRTYKNSKKSSISKTVYSRTFIKPNPTVNKNYFAGWKSVTKDLTREQIDKYTVKVTSNGETSWVAPAVIYNLRGGKTLELHLYINCVMELTEEDAAAEIKNYNKKKEKDRKNLYERYKRETKQRAIDGIKNVWNSYIQGNANDFKPNVAFKTEVIIHETTPDKHNCITLQFGGDENTWYETGGAFYSVKNEDEPSLFDAAYMFWSDEFRVYLPSARMVVSTGKIPYRGDSYGCVVAHELGHVLGLDDAYRMDNAKKPTIIKNDETTAWDESKKMYNNLMDHNLQMILPNDIEMALTAYNDSIDAFGDNGRFAWQSYKTYSYDQCKYIISKAIKNRIQKYQQ